MNIKSNYIEQFHKKVLDTILSHRLIEQGEKVLVGVSGGPDSVCLLHLLKSFSKTLQFEMHAVHVNHMLRAEEAGADEVYTANLCREMGVNLDIVRIDIAAMAKEKGISLEEAGRIARYNEFSRHAESVGASKIAVAHNRNDQAETVMMNILRGTGTAGLAGMDFRRGNIIRPLLNVSREEIERYCSELGLSPRTDSSNLTQCYTRNKIRLGLFPYIEENFKTDMIESLNRLSTNASIDNNYLERQSLAAYEDALQYKESGLVALGVGQLRELDPAILGRVLKLALKDAAGRFRDVGSVHYGMLAELVRKGRTGMSAELPGGIGAAVSYGVLKIFDADIRETGGRQREKTEFSYKLEIPGTTLVPCLNSEVRTTVEDAINIDKSGVMEYNPLVRFFDYDKLKEGIYIRNRRNGDIFKPFRSTGTKKLKEFFIDGKIPREQRDSIPLICKGNEVVWVVGYKTSDKFKLTENTKSVLKIEYIRRGST
ncbi:MAG: tRNA lysidine(34) synthetase TilS [Bacillota bacterium]